MSRPSIKELRQLAARAGLLDQIDRASAAAVLGEHQTMLPRDARKRTAYIEQHSQQYAPELLVGYDPDRALRERAARQTPNDLVPSRRELARRLDQAPQDVQRDIHDQALRDALVHIRKELRRNGTAR